MEEDDSQAEHPDELPPLSLSAETPGLNAQLSGDSHNMASAPMSPPRPESLPLQREEETRKYSFNPVIANPIAASLTLLAMTARVKQSRLFCLDCFGSLALPSQ